MQEGIDEIAAGSLTGGNRIVDVHAGTYAELVSVNKSLKLLGANDGIAGAEARGTESLIHPAGNTLGGVITVTANDVTISGFKISGDDPLTIGSPVFSGADANALYGITNGNTVTATPIDGLTLHDNIVERVAIGILGNGVSGSSTTSAIDANLFQDIGVFDFGYAISLRNNFYADITNNVMQRVFTGVHLNNFYTAKGSPWLMQGNQISSYANGLWHNNSYGSATPLAVATNQFVESAGAVANDIGILITNGPGNVAPVLTGNTITNHDYGVVIWDTQNAPVIGSSNSISGTVVGVYVTNNVGFNPIGTTSLGLVSDPTAVVIDGLTISNSTTGVQVRGDSGGGAVTATIQNETEISGIGAGTGVLVEGPTASATIQNNDNSIHEFLIGVDVNAGNATIANNHIYDNATGIRFTNDGGGSLSGNNFDGGLSADNATDLRLDSSADTVTIGASNAFTGDTFFIDNQSTQSYDLSSNGTTFDETNNFRIEDKMHHRVDTDLPVTTGLITWVAGNLYVTDVGTDHSIQRGIDAASSDNTVNVEAGTYQENVTVNKGLTIKGANAGTAGSDLGRGAESIVLTSGNQAQVFLVSASNVTIDGFVVDGDDPLVVGGTLSSGDDANVLYGVKTSGTISGLTVQNNIIRHASIGVRGDGTSSGNLITRNWFDSIGAYDFGYAVTLRTNFYADVTNNLMTRVHSGLHTNNFFGSGGPSTWLFQDNIVQAYAAGVWDNLQYNGATSLTIDHNDISSLTSPLSAPNRALFDGLSVGILLVTLQNTVGVTITNNAIDGMAYGVVLYNTETSSIPTIGGSNTITNNGVGVYLTNIVGFNPVSATVLGGAANNPTGVGRVVLDDLNLNGNSTGVLVQGDNPVSPFGAVLTLQNATTISGGSTGLELTGALAAVNAATLADTAFSAQTGQYIVLADGAMVGQEINGTNAVFDGLTGGARSVAQNYTLEDKITHALDDSGVGFVRVKSGHVFVTPNSFVSPFTSPDVQRAVDATTNGDTVHIQTGSYTGSVDTESKGLTLDLG